MNNNIEYISKIKKGEEASFRHLLIAIRKTCSIMHSVSYEPKKPLKK